MLNRRWMTAWRLLKSGQLKEFSKRAFRFLYSLNNSSKEVEYSEWRKKWVELDENERQKIKDYVDSLTCRPSFTLLLDANDHTQDALFKTVKSVLAQLYPHWFLWIINAGSHDSNLERKIDELQDTRIKLSNSFNSEIGDWVIELTSGIELTENALFATALSTINKPIVEVVYSDHDHIDPSGEFCDPYMKPDWNPDLFAAMNYFGPLIACKRELWQKYSYERSDLYDFLLEVTENASSDQIFHISDVLASIPVAEDDKHLEPPCKRVSQPLPEPEPLVSILIPTRDNGQMLEKCLESLFNVTSYPNLEVVLVDHETSETKALKVIKEFENKENCRTINFSGSFNFAAMMNLAGNAAVGEVLVLLNNDVEVIDSGWLTELVSQVLRADVGVAGALLLFGDGTIQHAGVHPGLGGLMGHGHKHVSGDDPGYFNRLKAVHGVAAVTGACLAVEKSTWVELNGMNEDLAVAYNDIDFCLKARKRGLRVIFTPFSILLHHESLTRGIDPSVEKNHRLRNELEVMKSNWGEFIYSDPAYSPNLSFDGGGFKLSMTPKKSFKYDLKNDFS